MYWYQEEIEALHTKGKKINYKARTIFYGSSSFRLWENLETVFRIYDPVNLGFGGSTLAACAWYFESVFDQYKPESIIIYAGDNDLADGRHPEEVLLNLELIRIKIRNKYGNIPITFISIKPSICRMHLIDSIRYVNLLAEELTQRDPHFYYVNIHDRMLNDKGEPIAKLFDADELHLSPEGYLTWQEELHKHNEIFPQPCKENITNGLALP